MDPVENTRWFLGFGVIGERGLAGDEVGLDVIAAGIGGGNELVGAAIEEEGCAGLLSDMSIGTGIGESVRRGVGPEGLIRADGGTGAVLAVTR